MSRKREGKKMIENLRQMFTIQTTSTPYQMWKAALILLSLFSSFHYAYHAAFHHIILDFTTFDRID